MDDRGEKGWCLSYGVFSRWRGELMGLAMLWILLFHAFWNVPETEWLKVLKSKGYFGVDIFIFLSALGLSLSLCRKKQSFWAYCKRRLVRILPTFWLVTGLYGLFLRLTGQVSLKGMFWTMSTLFYWFDKPNYFNWYIPGLLFFYLLIPAVTALLRRCKYRRCLTAGLCLLSFPLFHLALRHGQGHIGDVLQRIPAFLLGILAGIYISEDRPIPPGELWGWAVLPFLVPVARELAQPYYFPGGFSFAFGCVDLCLALAGLAAALPERGARQGLRLLGECSLEIYLLNVIFVLELPRFSSFLPLGERYRLYYLITIPANILLGVGLHYALKRPLAWLSRKVTG